MVSAADLKIIMPHSTRIAEMLDPLNAAMEEYGIVTPPREAMFLAQVAHESSEMNFLREIWGPTAAQSRYEGNTRLGNTQPGDGKRFRGRGLIQVTGRANYLLVGGYLGVDLIAHPELLEQPVYAARSAGLYWQRHKLNNLADLGLIVPVTKAINGGLNGIDSRIKYWQTAKKVLGVS